MWGYVRWKIFCRTVLNMPYCSSLLTNWPQLVLSHTLQAVALSQIIGITWTFLSVVKQKRTKFTHHHNHNISFSCLMSSNELVSKLHNDPGFDMVTGITEAVSFQPTAILGSGMRVCHEADPTKIVLDVLPLSQSESKSVRQPSPSAGGMYTWCMETSYNSRFLVLYYLNFQCKSNRSEINCGCTF